MLEESGDRQAANKRHSKLATVCRASSHLLLALLLAAFSLSVLVQANPRQQQQQQQATNDNKHEPTGQKGADFEAELNSIVQQQQQEALEGNNKQLAEAIISRLMLDNLTGSGMSSASSGASDLENEIQAIVGADEAAGAPGYSAELPVGELAPAEQPLRQGPSAAEAQRLRKLLNFLQNYEAGYLAGQAFSPFPLLPSGQAATMKRAAAKMNAYLAAPQRHLASQAYGRNSFDFGLGKRPDSSIAGNILRFGDSSLGVNGGSIQPVGSFGKRPSAQRYDFGLGKRVANPAYPRYDFGLGKRAPNRIRYDFGLGK